MLQLDARHAVEHLAQQMVERAVAGRGIAELVGPAPGHGDQLGHGFGRKAGMGQQHIGHGADQADGPEVLHRIEARLAVQRGVDGLAAADGHQQRMAVARRLGHGLGADVAARAGPVLDHHAGAQHLGQLLAHQPAHDVIGAAGRLRDDHHDGPRGPGLGMGQQRGGECSGQQASAAQKARRQGKGRIRHGHVSICSCRKPAWLPVPGQRTIAHFLTRPSELTKP